MLNISEQSNRIAILGAAESGLGAALLAKAKGFVPFVSDAKSINEKFKNELLNNNIDFQENGHTEKVFDSSLVVKSPGIPDDNALVLQLGENNKREVISEIEWASRFTNSPITAITGTNGKTTTTKLTHHLYATHGLDAGLAGNIGPSFARRLAETDHQNWVLEVSSFQLDGTKHFKPHIAILLNITPDHLDRYQYKFSNYVESKFSLVRNLDENGYFIANLDNPPIASRLSQAELRCRLLGFGLQKHRGSVAFREDKKLVFQAPRPFVLLLEDLPLPGEHNQLNAMAAILAALVSGVSDENIIKALSTFVNDPHRLENVRELNGVLFVNDSKATNVDSVLPALSAYPKPIIWIAGGVDKGNDYDALKPFAKKQVKALIALGTDNKKLIEAFQGEIPVIKEANSMEKAVQTSFELAKNGDVVLLSPACASFDLFKNYEDRGNQFKLNVNSL